MSFMSCYTLNYPTQKNKYAPGKHVIGQPVTSNESGTKQWAEGVNEETWEEGKLSNKTEKPEK